MKRALLVAFAVLFAWGCRSQSPPGQDPFFGRTTVPPPATGAAARPPDPYYRGPAGAGGLVGPAPNAPVAPPYTPSPAAGTFAASPASPTSPFASSAAPGAASPAYPGGGVPGYGTPNYAAAPGYSPPSYSAPGYNPATSPGLPSNAPRGYAAGNGPSGALTAPAPNAATPASRPNIWAPASPVSQPANALGPSGTGPGLPPTGYNRYDTPANSSSFRGTAAGSPGANGLSIADSRMPSTGPASTPNRSEPPSVVRIVEPSGRSGLSSSSATATASITGGQQSGGASTTVASGSPNGIMASRPAVVQTLPPRPAGDDPMGRSSYGAASTMASARSWPASPPSDPRGTLAAASSDIADLPDATSSPR